VAAKQTQTEQAPPQQQGGLAAVGATLASAREEQRLKIEAVASELHLRPEVVQSLEAGDEAQLPSTFVRGYVKAYARLLGLDEAAIVGQLPGVNERSPAPLKRIGMSRRRVAPSVGRSLLWGIGLLGFVVVAGYGVPTLQRLWSGQMSDSVSDQLNIPLPGAGEVAAPQTSETEALEAIAMPADDDVAAGQDFETEAPDEDAVPLDEPLEESVAALPEAAPEPAAAEPEPQTQPVAAEEPTTGPAVVELRFTEDSWVEMEANGRKLVVGTQRAGTERTVRAEPPVDLLLGNAPGVEVTFRGKPVDVSAHLRGKVARLTLED
jgi:cytoskeleton protein RodZ